MHIQSPPSGWLEAVNILPDYALVKSVSDAAPLLDAKLRWQALGRDPKKLFTAYRHFDIEPAPIGTWESALAHWRRMFARFVDKTWLERYAKYVDFVLDCNEYTAASTWTDPADKARVLMSMRAGATVWNKEYRGRDVHSADGGFGHIPDACKFVLMCGPVSNAFPVEVFDVALDNDCPISYHAYTRYEDKVRYVNDWHDDSGLWDVLEQKYGKKPYWMFGECTPYRNAQDGWRAEHVLGGDVNLLVGAMRAWWLDCAKTDAYKSGRLIGPGAWFTCFGGWKYYNLETPQLLLLAQAAHDLWHPGDDIVDKNKVLAELDKIETSTATIRAEVLSPVPFKVQAHNPCPLYDVPNGKVLRTLTDSRIMDVYEVKGTWLRVTNTATIYWAKLSDVILV